MYAGFLDLTRPLFWTVDDALPPDLCADYIRRFHAGQPELAPIVGERGEPVVEPRPATTPASCGTTPTRPDASSATSAPTSRPASPASTLVGANPRLRIYRYGPGERHGAHWDTVVELADGVRSLLTLVFYLNDGFTGGDTDFVELGARVTPKAGRALLFQHRVMHRASEVDAARNSSSAPTSSTAPDP
jgi:prolyl 4-hydroxylase